MGKQGQGATEYLVILSVVLIIALVSLALLGFFPGMSADARETESAAYWRSASPIAITEWGGQIWPPNNSWSIAYLRMRNNGNYPITITKIFAGSQNISQLWESANATINQISSYSYYNQIQPGTEVFIGCGYGGAVIPGLDICYGFLYSTAGSSNRNYLYGASSLCINETQFNRNLGFIEVKDFGFEYIEHVEGSQIIKRQTGKVPLIIKCTAAGNG